MRFIVRAVKAKRVSDDDLEFDEFCRSVLTSLEESDFFESPAVVTPDRDRRTTALLEVLTVLCVT